MIPPETLSLFFAASLALACAPGPDNIFVLTQSALHGRAAGLFVTLGLCSGLVAHTTGVALGLAAVIQSSPNAFNIIKWSGSVYLLYLAWVTFRSQPSTINNNPRSSQHPTDVVPPHRKLYVRGIIMNVTNPKVTIFFLAFLPQFTVPSQGNLPLQFFTLGAVFLVATLLVFSAIAIASSYIGNLLKRSKTIQTGLNRFAALVFIGLAIRLATSTR